MIKITITSKDITPWDDEAGAAIDSTTWLLHTISTRAATFEQALQKIKESIGYSTPDDGYYYSEGEDNSFSFSQVEDVEGRADQGGGYLCDYYGVVEEVKPYILEEAG